MRPEYPLFARSSPGFPHQGLMAWVAVEDHPTGCARAAADKPVRLGIPELLPDGA
jgi:hypothetical protein